MGWHASNDGGDALIEEGHCSGRVDERYEGLSQLLAEARLQWCESSKLGGKGENPLVSGRAGMVCGLTSLIILISIQLLVDEVISLKKIGARER